MTTAPDYPASYAEAMARLQTMLPTIKKSETADVRSEKGSYSYHYADLAQVTRELMPILGELGLSFSAKPMLNDRGDFVLAYRMLHTSGQEDGGEYPLPRQGTPQILGGAITYARRYCLCAMAGIAPEDDDDASAASADYDGSRSAQRAQRQAAGSQRTRQAKTGDGPTAQRAQRATNDAAPPLPGETGERWTRDQQAKMMATFADIGLPPADRERRLDVTSRIVGQRLGSANELTVAMAGRVIEALDEAATKEDPLTFLDVTYPEPTEGEGP